MASTPTALSFSEYLTTSFPDLDREYAYGEVRERAMPDIIHSRIQARLAALFENKSAFRPWIVCPELRLMLRPGLVRIPDLSVYEGEQPTSNPTATPPLIAFEIISRDDRYSDVSQKLEENRQWGVVHIWVVDPWLAKL